MDQGTHTGGRGRLGDMGGAIGLYIFKGLALFEQNAGGTFVARVDSDELVPFLHEEMRVELPMAESAAQRLTRESRVRLQNIFLEENNLHAVMDYLEEDI